MKRIAATPGKERGEGGLGARALDREQGAGRVLDLGAGEVVAQVGEVGLAARPVDHQTRWPGARATMVSSRMPPPSRSRRA
jgi:hypothetical protein